MATPEDHVRRILLVEDDPGLGGTLAERLKREGYAVEVLVRVEARSGPSIGDAVPRLREHAIYTCGDLRLDVRRAEVWRGQEPVVLSAREFRLLRYFLEHRGATLSRDELLNEVWGYDAVPTTRTVDVHVAWLRRKIEPNPRRPQYLLTVHGLGYKFVK